MCALCVISGDDTDNKSLHVDWHSVHAKVTSGNDSTVLTRYHAWALADHHNNMPNVARRNPWIRKNANPCNNSYLSVPETLLPAA